MSEIETKVKKKTAKKASNTAKHKSYIVKKLKANGTIKEDTVITFSQIDTGVYRANPNYSNLKHNWAIILDDNINHVMRCFLIPRDAELSIPRPLSDEEIEKITDPVLKKKEKEKATKPMKLEIKVNFAGVYYNTLSDLVLSPFEVGTYHYKVKVNE